MTTAYNKTKFFISFLDILKTEILLGASKYALRYVKDIYIYINCLPAELMELFDDDAAAAADVAAASASCSVDCWIECRLP